MKPSPSAPKMNKGSAAEPSSGHKAPAAATGPGPETKPDIQGALASRPSANNPLHGAIQELGADRIGHAPLHGMTVKGEG